MKSLKSMSIILGLSFVNLSAQAMEATFVQLTNNVEKGCPTVWEDPAIPIDDSLAVSALFSTAVDADGKTDVQAFRDFYRLNNQVTDADTNVVTDPVTDAELDMLLTNKKAISFECNSHRKLLLETMLSTNSLDSAQALEAALGVADAIDFSSRQWRVGDLRVTGRSAPDDGWLFPAGQTIGATNSDAQLNDDKYESLFNLAKTWSPNSGAKTWGASGDSGVVTLPDMRGKAVYAADNMGGASANVVTDVNADTIGGAFGEELNPIAIANIPSHRHLNSPNGAHGHTSNNNGVHLHPMNAVGGHAHGMANSGTHGHTVGQAGLHGHSVRTSVHAGSSAARSDYPYFEGRARPNYQNNIPSAVQQAGNHSHTVSSSGLHKHTVSSAGAHTPVSRNAGNHNHVINGAPSHSHTSAYVGGGQALKTISPGISMNIEIKY